MKYNRSLLRQFGSGEVKSIRYKNYPLRDTFFYPVFASFDSPLPLQLHSSGSDVWHCRGYSERYSATILSLEYVTRGTFVFTQNGEENRVHAGEMFLVHPGKDSSIYCEPVTAEKRMLILRGSLLELICSRIGLEKINKFVPENKKVIDDFYDEIIALANSGTCENYHRACSLCYNLLIEISRQSKKKSLPYELQKILDFIHQNLTRKVALQELLQVSNMSNTTLNQVFHKYLNTSPMDYFLDQQLELAKNLLENSQDSVKEIAAMLGFSTPQYFATRFKEKFHLSPTAFRKK